ncbi:MAG TPA: CoA transferase [Chloroflexota bacterium]
MAADSAPPAALEGLRVLDLTDLAGMYCGKLLADLGADVILIEPPSGAQARRMGPYLDDQIDPERSLTFWYLNTSKRGITLDLDQPDGVALLGRLAANADVVIESLGVGYLAARGLAYETLATANPRLVLTSISPFGQTGPYAAYQGGDLVQQALGGLAWLTGFAGQPPVKLGGTQGFEVAAQQAAVGTLIAVYAAETSGQGQHVDVSSQEAVAFATQPAAHFATTTGEVLRRNGNDYARYGVSLPCRDGFVAASFNRADVRARAVEWLADEGQVGDLRDPKWQDTEATTEFRRQIMRRITPLVAERTKLDTAVEAQKRKIWMTPVNTTLDLPSDPHLRARDYFAPVEHPELGRVIEYPGGPYQLSATLWRIRRRAPLLGEHTVAVLRELGLDDAAVQALGQAGAI